MIRRVVLVGATGVFGSRLAAMLSRLPDVELVLCARHFDGLERLRNELAPAAKAQLSVAAFDRDKPDELPALQPWLLVDAAGPFQDSGYGLALATVGCGAHYVDLADSRSFVAGFPDALREAAHASGVLAVTGASSTPALSHAALDALVAGWSRIDAVAVAISPGARAPRGRAVVEAILSYVGRPVRVWRGDGWREAPGWSGATRIRMPGLGRRWVSLCETPDLDLLPARFPIRDEAVFRAGLELAPMQWGLAALGWLVRLRLLTSLRLLADPLRALAGVLAPFGSDRGGMTVEARGLDGAGQPVEARWALWAEANAGPHTPAAPAAALVRALVEGRETRRGAHAAAGLLPLAAILRELDGLPIRTERREIHPHDPALFRRRMGARFDTLPASLRAVHGAQGTTFDGRASARAGRSLAARAMRAVLGLPRSGRTPVQVTIARDARGETWTRRFGTARFASRLVDGADHGEFEERFGPLRFTFALESGARGVRWRPVGWSLAGLPLPRALMPRIRAAAEDVEGRYRFRVVAAHPWTGLLFAYRGVLD